MSNLRRSTMNLECSEEIAPPLVRAGKQPMIRPTDVGHSMIEVFDHVELDSDEEGSFEDADLHLFFQRTGLSDHEIISVCRSYASYLAAKQKGIGEAKKRKLNK